VFDIAPDDISLLSDSDLRELVGRLCEAEVINRGLSAVGVTWGGNQTAADGGVDVRVVLPRNVSIEGFIPRLSTVFQVKAQDMPESAILAEMRPSGMIRTAIRNLAGKAGAYIVVSSKGSTADTALQNRRRAMREALNDLVNSDQLHTDFYDRTRIATWVRCHPGLVAWVKERVGRAFIGWHPYGPWTGAAEGIDAEYLLDDKLSLRLGEYSQTPVESVVQGIDSIRASLAQPGEIVRLVGLSGVGKTRLAQALFDARIGSRPLSTSLAIYTNLSDNPDPHPTGLASDLIANRKRAVLVVDNCPPDLHRRLSDLCSGQSSTVSVLTIEYDVRDDQPEGTHVVALDTASPDLIQQLVARRYPHLSQVDASTIAEVSGGNARIAIALVETIERSGTIAGLSNEELFQRLFYQRHGPNNPLLLAAQACSLVYSFNGEVLDEEEAEIPRLAVLAGQNSLEIHRHVGELLRRDLAQQRGVWRAVLPHAIANRLAARALEEIPSELIERQLIDRGTERLARSFSRRLSFLHDHPTAVAIVERWLAPDGHLGDVTALNDLGRSMFTNVAPVQPDAAMAALERACNYESAFETNVLPRYLTLLRSLAYDPTLFERSTKLLIQAAVQCTNDHEAKQASDAFVSLFTIFLSGTHASVEQRHGVIKWLLESHEEKLMALGLNALDQILKTRLFNSWHRFEFGSRSRDFGYQPRSASDQRHWYSSTLSFVESLALSDGFLEPFLRELLARNFRDLWALTYVHDQLESLARQFSAAGFWCGGWLACRSIMRFDRERLGPEVSSRLSILESELKPSTLQDRVRATVLVNSSAGLDLGDMNTYDEWQSATERLEQAARSLGEVVARDIEVFDEILPELLMGGCRTWSFGRGLAGGASDVRAIWIKLVKGMELVSADQRNASLLIGFLAELSESNRDLVQEILDAALAQPHFVVFLPVLQCAVGLDEPGIERLERSLNEGQVPILMYQHLASGRATNQLTSATLKRLLLLIADQSEGLDVAFKILVMRLFSDRSERRPHCTDILEAGRELLWRVAFRGGSLLGNHNLAEVAEACVSGPDAEQLASQLTVNLKQANRLVGSRLISVLLHLHPCAVMDALFMGEERNARSQLSMFDHCDEVIGNPLNAITCEDLIAWCQGDPYCRYSQAASVIAYGCRPEVGSPQEWSNQAKAILAAAPDPRSVLDVFIGRFRPMSWEGSRAATMEANAQLLDCVVAHVPSDLGSFVADAKSRLAQEIASVRQREKKRARENDEQFE
jgi:hypothetical protein